MSILLTLYLASCIKTASHDFSLLTFNVQNLFDGSYQGGEYSEFIFPAWTEVDYQKRLISIGTALQSLPTTPSIIALQEVENEKVVLELQQFYFPQLPYVVVSQNEHSSVQNAVLSKYKIVDVHFHNVDRNMGKGMRDIMDVVLSLPATRTADRVTLQLIVVHLKSQRDHTNGILPREIREYQYTLVNSIIDTTMPTIIVGDFNDEYPLVHFSTRTVTESVLHTHHKTTKGTYYFKNSWIHIDHILLDDLARAIFDDEVLLVQDVEPFINSNKVPNTFYPYRKDFTSVSDHVPLLFLARMAQNP